MKKNKPLFVQGQDWDFALLEQFDKLTDKYGKELGIEWYPLQIEVVSADQMLDLYSSVALPVNYNYWAYGKNYLRDYKKYHEGKMGLAFEICANTNPSMCYIMSNNDALMQYLVIAHVKGHSSHFRMNYVFKENSDADNIVNYMLFARDFIQQCEGKHGLERVEYILDLAHCLQNQGIDKFKRKHNTIQQEVERQKAREEHKQAQADYFLDSLVKNASADAVIIDEDTKVKNSVQLPEDNILYFLEKSSLVLKRWEREILRIVRKVAQYFYPQMHGNVLSEGTASYVHYYMMKRAHEENYIDDGAYLQFLHSHSSVLHQWDFTKENREKYKNLGITDCKFNPYFLGFKLLNDVQRICENPTEEDRHFFPNIAGSPWLPVFHDMISNYRDESLIRQFLSPHLMRELRMMHLQYDVDEHPEHILVAAHCSDEHYKNLRTALADTYMIDNRLPEIFISEVNSDGLILQYNSVKGRKISVDDAYDCCENISILYGSQVFLQDEKGELIIAITK